MHLVSRVVGELRHDLDALRLSRLHEHGHPERRAESTRHAVDCRCGRTAPRRYGGAVGYFTAHGDLDTCIVIRSALVENGIATVQAGAGILYRNSTKPSNT